MAPSGQRTAPRRGGLALTSFQNPYGAAALCAGLMKSGLSPSFILVPFQSRSGATRRKCGAVTPTVLVQREIERGGFLR